MPSNYQAISIPREMYDDILRFIGNSPGLGYSSVPEFVKDAVRKSLSNAHPAIQASLETTRLPPSSSIQEVYKLMSAPARFTDIIFSATGHSVIPFNSMSDREFLGALERVVVIALKDLGAKLSDIFRDMSDDVKIKELKALLISALEKNRSSTRDHPRVERLQGNGYPDLVAENSNGEKAYLTLKVTANQEYRDFYFIRANKISASAKHLLLIVNVSGTLREGITSTCTLKDLSTLTLALDAEFRASSSKVDETATLLEFRLRDGIQYSA